jgi:hypothetical protein
LPLTDWADSRAERPEQRNCLPKTLYGGVYAQYPFSEYWDVEARAFKERNPAQYLTNEKARIVEYKKSAYYQHYLDVKKQAHEDSLKLMDDSNSSPKGSICSMQLKCSRR